MDSNNLFQWFIIVMIILRFTPNNKIKVMGDFFAKILPRLPITTILKHWSKKNDL